MPKVNIAVNVSLIPIKCCEQSTNMNANEQKVTTKWPAAKEGFIWKQSLYWQHYHGMSSQDLEIYFRVLYLMTFSSKPAFIFGLAFSSQSFPRYDG